MHQSIVFLEPDRCRMSFQVRVEFTQVLQVRNGKCTGFSPCRVQNRSTMPLEWRKISYLVDCLRWRKRLYYFREHETVGSRVSRLFRIVSHHREKQDTGYFSHAWTARWMTRKVSRASDDRGSFSCLYPEFASCVASILWIRSRLARRSNVVTVSVFAIFR